MTLTAFKDTVSCEKHTKENCVSDSALITELSRNGWTVQVRRRDCEALQRRKAGSLRTQSSGPQTGRHQRQHYISWKAASHSLQGQKVALSYGYRFKINSYFTNRWHKSNFLISSETCTFCTGCRRVRWQVSYRVHDSRGWFLRGWRDGAGLDSPQFSPHCQGLWRGNDQGHRYPGRTHRRSLNF